MVNYQIWYHPINQDSEPFRDGSNRPIRRVDPSVMVSTRPIRMEAFVPSYMASRQPIMIVDPSAMVSTGPAGIDPIRSDINPTNHDSAYERWY